MPHSSLNKTASRTVKSLDDLVSVIAKHKGSSARDMAHEMLNSGSGSILLDGVGSITKKIPKVNTINNGFKHMQSKVNDIDIKVGNKIHEALSSKGHLGKKVSNAFTYEHEVPTKSVKGKPDEFIKVKVPMASAPFENAKRIALPIAGSAYVADKVVNTEHENNKGGDTVKAANFSREDLMNKIANHISGEMSESTAIKSEGQDKKASELLLKASQMLKFAAEERRQMMSDMEKMAYECKTLHESLNMRDKQDKAVKLAEEMNEKGMIKKADIEKKASEIMTLDNDAYELLKQATENVHLKEEKNGVDNLTFLSEDYNIKSSKRKTLADTLED